MLLAEGRNAARIGAQDGRLGSAWMQVTYFDPGGGLIRPEEYRLGLRWHLGLPVLAEETVCPACGQVCDTLGDHLVCCRRNNYYGRHFAVQESLAAMATAGGQSFIREAPLVKMMAQSSGPEVRLADLLLRAWQVLQAYAYPCSLTSSPVRLNNGGLRGDSVKANESQGQSRHMDPNTVPTY